MPAVATAFCAWARIEMNSTCRPPVEAARRLGNPAVARYDVEDARDRRAQQLVVQPLEHRPEHQHLLLAPRRFGKLRCRYVQSTEAQTRNVRTARSCRTMAREVAVKRQLRQL
jgi:hypothetical protein